MIEDITNNLSLIDSVHFAVMRGRGIGIEIRLDEYMNLVRAIDARDMSGSSDSKLQRTAAELKRLAAEGISGDELMTTAFALVREACRRKLGQDPYAVQMIAGIALHQGKLAQMKTGEGKTLAAVFPAFLNALPGKGVHIMTANDYLAERDAKWMGQVYRFLGLTVGFIREKMTAAERREAYRADITYLTAKQGGFDFLRDQLCFEPEDTVQREPNMVIVDEADFIMIDEARTPLVIAAGTGAPNIDPYVIDRAAGNLVPEKDFIIDRTQRNCGLTIQGEKKVGEILGCGGMHEEEHYQTFAAVHVALHARHMLKKDVDYIVREGCVELVDEFTGRIADKRRWPYGIQTALEAKEGLVLKPEGKVCGSITVQNFITRYPKLAAMTATAVPAAEEFLSFYGLPVVVIPPNKPEKMVHLPDLVFATAEAKMKAVVREIENVHGTCRPVLLGTRSVHESEELARKIRERGIPCSVLNAKNDEQEAELIAEAGALGAVTISTNMAGRGTDIKLGGEAGDGRKEIVELGGLYVIGTNKHESVRVDNQLRGRAGRQGDPGQSRFFISLEDDLMVRYGIPEFIPERILRTGEGGLIRDIRAEREINRAQGIIEHQHFEMRRTLRRYSLLVEKQRRIIQDIRQEVLFREIFPEGFQMIDGLSADLHKKVLLYYLDRFWSDHLALIDDIREGIHLQRYAGIDPILVFIKQVSAAFDAGLDDVFMECGEKLQAVKHRGDDALEELDTLQGLGNTWTYLINDNPFPLFSLSAVAHNNIGSAVAAGVVSLIKLPGQIIRAIRFRKSV